MRVMVTGGSGFIGGYVCDELRSRGHDVLRFDRHNGDYLGDVRDEGAVLGAMSVCDGFIHLAAMLGTQETIDSSKIVAENNITGSLNILDAAKKNSTPGVYISVGNHWMNNPYSITKSTVERFVAMYNKECGTRINMVRAMNAYGPGQKAAPPFGYAKVRKITPSFVCRAINNVDVEVYGDGLQVSDMVYVGDVAKALVTALEKAADGDVFSRCVEVGPETHTTVREVAERVIALSGSKSKIVYLPMRPGEVAGDFVCADTETLKLVDMSPDELTSLDEGLMKTIDYFREPK